MPRSGSAALYCVAGRVTDSDGQLTGVELPLLASAVEQPGIAVAVQLEVPVRVRGEPVVVAAVQHDGVLVADAALGEQRLELLLVDEVPTDRVLQVGLPVDLDRAGDVATVVRRGVLVDLDQHHVRCRLRAPRPSRRRRVPLACSCPVLLWVGDVDGGISGAQTRRGACAQGCDKPGEIRVSDATTERRAHPAVVNGQAAGERNRPRGRRDHGDQARGGDHPHQGVSRQMRRSSSIWTPHGVVGPFLGPEISPIRE